MGAKATTETPERKIVRCGAQKREKKRLRVSPTMGKARGQLQVRNYLEKKEPALGTVSL